MRSDKTKAFSLRKSGKSYKEIKAILGVPKSTLSDWLSKNNWSRKIKTALVERSKISSAIRMRELGKVRKQNLTRAYADARKEAKQELAYFKLFPLFVLGVGIYWGEGDKRTHHSVKVSNTDPLMIKLFVRFLKEICGIRPEKIRASILLYPDLNEKICKKYWVEQAGLKETNFTKTITIIGRHKTNRLQYGVCMICVSSTYLKEKMKVWLNLLPKELIKENLYKIN